MNTFASLVGILALTLAPIVFLLWFVYTRDKLEPEPHGLVLKVFWLGMVAFIPAILIRHVLPLPYLVMGLVVVPVVNELAKFVVVRFGVYNHAEFDEPLDGIIFAAVAGLGFATLDILVSLLLTYFNVSRVAVPGEAAIAPFQAVLSLFAIQGLLGAPGHALWSALWGFGLGLAKFAPPEQGQKYAVGGLLVAILSHAVFNACALETDWWVNRLGLGLLIVVLWFVVMRCIRTAESLSPFSSR